MGRLCAEQRKELHLTQIEVARRVGVTGPQLSRIETGSFGKRGPRWDLLLRLAATLGVPSDRLYPVPKKKTRNSHTAEKPKQRPSEKEAPRSRATG